MANIHDLPAPSPWLYLVKGLNGTRLCLSQEHVHAREVGVRAAAMLGPATDGRYRPLDWKVLLNSSVEVGDVVIRGNLEDSSRQLACLLDGDCFSEFL
jgi:hypothetical protein